MLNWYPNPFLQSRNSKNSQVRCCYGPHFKRWNGKKSLRRDGWWGAGEQNNHLRMGSAEKGSEATLSVCQLFPLVFWTLFLFLPSQHNGLVLLTLKTHSKSVINSYAVQNHHNHTANSVPKPRNAHLCWVQNQCIQSSSLELLFQPSEVNPILNDVVCLIDFQDTIRIG